MSITPKEVAELAPIETDERMNRHYIPLPGGWEIQTKGGGSSFRIAETKGERHRWLLVDASDPKDYSGVAAMLERMAREIHQVHQAQAETIKRLEAETADKAARIPRLEQLLGQHAEEVAEVEPSAKIHELLGRCADLDQQVEVLTEQLQSAQQPSTASVSAQDEPGAAISEDVRAALLFALWCHQGGSSRVGQPIRAMLGIGRHERMGAEQCDIARKVQSALAWAAAAPEVPEDSVLIERQTLNEWWCQLLATDHVAEGWTSDRCLKVADEMRVKFDANYLPAPAPVWVILPEGWRLVPKVATDAIEQAIADWIGQPCKAGELWDLLLAAAPQPEGRKS